MKLDMRKKQEKKETTKVTKKLPMTAKMKRAMAVYSVLASTMISNSEYIVMLNQAEPDRAKLATLLNISTEQMGYITNADAGCGLVKYGSSLVPFVNRFPTNTRLYKLMTTKPGEDSINRGRM